MEVSRRLAETAGVAAIELNISCPNVDSEGEQFGLRKESAAEVTHEVRQAIEVPLFVKLSPNVTDIVEIAEAVCVAGADALSLINTIPGMTIDLDKRRPELANVTGGLSGPAIRPIAVRIVYEVAQAVDAPIIGIGGISNTEDALQFIMAGARAVQVGTGTFFNPRTSLEVVEGLRTFLSSEGVEDINDLVGVAWK